MTIVHYHMERHLSASSDNDICPVCKEMVPHSESFNEHVNNCLDSSVPDDKPKSLEEHLERVKQKLVKAGTWDIHVLRENLIETALEELGDQHFNQFAKIHFIGEAGADDGGLTRDFFTNFFNLVPLFEGNAFAYDVKALQSQQFIHLGQVVAYALVLGHPGPQRLHQSIVSMLLTGASTLPKIIPLMLSMREHKLSSLLFKKRMQT